MPDKKRKEAEKALVALIRQPVAGHRQIVLSVTDGKWSIAIFTQRKTKARGGSFAGAWARLGVSS